MTDDIPGTGPQHARRAEQQKLREERKAAQAATRAERQKLREEQQRVRQEQRKAELAAYRAEQQRLRDERKTSQLTARRTEQEKSVAWMKSISDDELLQTEALEELVSQKLGRQVRQVGREELVQIKAPQRLRRYFKHIFVDDSGNPVPVFTKIIAQPAPNFIALETFLSNLDVAEFRVPKFYGALKLDAGRREGHVGVWECVSGQSIRGKDFTPEHYLRVIRAAARINSLTDEVWRHVPQIRVGLKRIRRVHETVMLALQDFSRRGADIADLMPLAERLARLEEPALARLAALGNSMFSHMNISPPNLFFEPQMLMIIDWDSACIGPPGCSLGMLGLLPNDRQAELIDYYVSCMAEHGITVAPADIRFTIQALHVLGILGQYAPRSAPGRHARPFEEDEEFGRRLNERAESQVRWGLQHVHYLE